MSPRGLLHGIQAFADLSASFRRRRRARFFRHGSVRFSGCCSFGDRCGFIGKIDLPNSPKTSANPYYYQQNPKCEENQATFPETAHSSFWRRLKLGIHFS